jgi:hypothetical protein
MIDGETRPNRTGIVRDASAGGARINSPSRFEKGDDMTLTLQLAEDSAVRVRARVVRVESAPAEMPWRWVIAVQFATPLPDAEHALRVAIR